MIESSNQKLSPELPMLTNKLRKNRLLLFGILFGLILVSLGGYFFVIQKKKGFSLPALTPETEEIPKAIESQSNANCIKIVEVIKESPSRDYIACSNNVFAIENGKITKQWTPEKLVSPKITSMAKVDNNLYIGNEGITSIGLDTDEIKRYDRNNGMEYVGNTLIAADDNTLWVGTFGDLYKLNLATEKLEQITKKVSSSKIGIEDIRVTSSSVFILTQEAVIRYDKASDQWEKFDESTFGTPPGTLSETVRSQLVYTKGMIVILQPYVGQNAPHHHQLWYAPDKINTNWQSLKEIISLIERDYPVVHGYTPFVHIVGYKEDGSVILRVGQYDDITHYYANPITKEIGLARKKYYGNYLKIDPEEEYRDFVNNVLRNK